MSRKILCTFTFLVSFAVGWGIADYLFSRRSGVNSEYPWDAILRLQSTDLEQGWVSRSCETPGGCLASKLGLFFFMYVM